MSNSKLRARVSLPQRHDVLKSINNPLQDSVLETTIMRVFTRGIRLPFVRAGTATGEPADFASHIDFTIRGRKMKDKWQRWKAAKKEEKTRNLAVRRSDFVDGVFRNTSSSYDRKNKSLHKISVISKSFPYSRTCSEPWNWKWRRFPYKRQASASLCSYTN